ncbi:MAG: hypothetical protein JW384_03646 [Nitrosomonadaceae bacterium]|nr:hypothetical protein [Nitrosomonadaceae bacterium]
MLLVLAHILGRPISLLRCPQPGTVCITNSTLCVNAGFAVWDQDSINEAHILLVYDSHHYNAMPLNEGRGGAAPEITLTYATATAYASASVAFAEAAGSEVFGLYHLRDDDVEPPVTVRHPCLTL